MHNLCLQWVCRWRIVPWTRDEIEQRHIQKPYTRIFLILENTFLILGKHDNFLVNETMTEHVVQQWNFSKHRFGKDNTWMAKLFSPESSNWRLIGPPSWEGCQKTSIKLLRRLNEAISPKRAQLVIIKAARLFLLFIF